MKKTIISAALLLLASALWAQNDDVYNESVVVKGSYTPVIEQAEKLYFPASISDTLGRIDHTFQYSITPTRLRATYQPTRIRAARIIGEPATKQLSIAVAEPAGITTATLPKGTAGVAYDTTIVTTGTIT